MELLVDWGVVNISGFIFKPILEEIAKLTTAALEDYVKNFFGVSIKNLVDIAKEMSLKIAFVKAIKEFLGLVQQELEDADLDDEIEHYKTSLKEFIGNKAVLEELGKPLQKALGNTTSETNSQTIDTTILIQNWNNLNLKVLPENFNWQLLAKRYVRKLNSILQDSDELQKVLDSVNLAGIRETIAQGSPIPPDFDFTRYQDGLMKAYGNLKLDSLDTSGSHYTLKLWNIFVAQKVREESSQKQTEGSVFDLLNNAQQNYKYTVILGNPGSGKSTLAQYKAIEWARKLPRDLPSQELPLLIELRNYIENKDNCNNFLEYLHKGTGLRGGNLNQREVDDWLKNQSSIVMLRNKVVAVVKATWHDDLETLQWVEALA